MASFIYVEFCVCVLVKIFSVIIDCGLHQLDAECKTLIGQRSFAFFMRSVHEHVLNSLVIEQRLAET